MIYKSKVTYSIDKLKGSYEDVEIKVTRYPTKFGSFIGFKEKESHYEGGCTVFYEAKNNFRRRCSTMTESWLHNIWYNFKRKNEQ